MKSISCGSQLLAPVRAATPLSCRCSLLLALICIFVPLCRSQQIPFTQAKTIDGSSVEFPNAESDKPLLFVVGFSHQSSSACQTWNKRLSPLYLKDPRVLYYQAADFQGVPSLITRMILHGMRRQVPANEQPRFVLLQANENEWKSAAKFSAANDAYVLLADSTGHIVWQTHGAVTEEQFGSLRAAMKTELGN